MWKQLGMLASEWASHWAFCGGGGGGLQKHSGSPDMRSAVLFQKPEQFIYTVYMQVYMH